MFDGKAFGEDIVEIVKDYLARELAPLRERLAAAEARTPDKGEPGRDGNDADSGQIIALTAAVAELKAAADLREDLRDAQHRAFMAEQRESLAALRADIDARMATVRDGSDADLGEVQRMIAEAVATVAIPEPGPNAAAIRTEVGTAIDAAIRALPAARDGTSVTVDDVRPLVHAEVARAVAALPTAKEGVSMAGAMIDRSGSLIITLSNGTLCDLGGVVGRDADPEAIRKMVNEAVDAIPRPANGKDADPAEIVRMVAEAVDGIPRPRDGVDGKDAYPGMACGLYRPDGAYRAMDVVSFNGAEWRAKRDDPGELPGEGWMLSAARGKRGDRGEPGEPGKAGKAGPAIVAAYLSASTDELVLTRDDGEEIKADLAAFLRSDG